MNNKISDLILNAFFCLVLCVGILFGINRCNNTSNIVIDKLSDSVHLSQTKLRDTIFVRDTIKQKAIIKYKLKRDTLWVIKPDSVNSIFNETFPRDSLDSSSYSTGYTQLRKAIDANNQRIRDSVIAYESTAQLVACTTTVNNIVSAVDSAKSEVHSKNNTVLIVSAVVAVIVSGLLLFAGIN